MYLLGFSKPIQISKVIAGHKLPKLNQCMFECTVYHVLWLSMSGGSVSLKYKNFIDVLIL